MADNNSTFRPPFTVRRGARRRTTGISAADRSRRSRAIDPAGRRRLRPARPHLPASRPRGGVLRGQVRPRRSSTWQGCRASIRPASICEIMNADGTMARLPDLLEGLAEHLGIKIISVARADRVPPPAARSSSSAAERDDPPHRVRRLPRHRVTKTSSIRGNTSPWSTATRAATSRCWSECTRSA